MCLGFKIQTLYFWIVNVLIKGVIEKPSGEYLGLIMMSNWLALVWIRIQEVSVVLPLGSEGQLLSDSYMVLTKLEERHVGSILGHRPSSLWEFWLAPIQPPPPSICSPYLVLKPSSACKCFKYFIISSVFNNIVRNLMTRFSCAV
jgi:hypothetical protein